MYGAAGDSAGRADTDEPGRGRHAAGSKRERGCTDAGETGDIFSHLDEIDTIIAAHSEGWNLNRIGKAELSILRLAVYEMKWDDTIPEKVAINEAVELAKTYCSEEAKGFVNAILGKMASGQD